MSGTQRRQKNSVAYFVKMEHKVQFAYVFKCAIQRLYEDLSCTRSDLHVTSRRAHSPGSSPGSQAHSPPHRPRTRNRVSRSYGRRRGASPPRCHPCRRGTPRARARRGSCRGWLTGAIRARRSSGLVFVIAAPRMCYDESACRTWIVAGRRRC